MARILGALGHPISMVYATPGGNVRTMHRVVVAPPLAVSPPVAAVAEEEAAVAVGAVVAEEVVVAEDVDCVPAHIWDL
ncbi:hypothetical protein ACMD2_19445 [Ananas comosus]|uniref:Uncharacterized protein n=1 Tax=Ananas comosus TaxID=4615 RepID=A0A199VV07_ANACO|nr:hypothetical protein ACMD2_19445 [Ananas comosus]